MVSVDTNVLLRLLLDDDPPQARAARRLFRSEQIWIAKTVLLETGWVLRSRYAFDEAAIRDAFTKLLGLENVQVEEEAAVKEALSLTLHGIELADAMHLASRPSEASFVSFDRRFVGRARRAGIRSVSSPKP